MEMDEDCPAATTKQQQSCLRRRSVGTDSSKPRPDLSDLNNLNVSFKITEGRSVIKGTPSPGAARMFPGEDGEDMDEQQPSSSSRAAEFRKKQQSFEIHIEDCDEEELSGASDDEGGPSIEFTRPHTPAHILQYPDHGGDIMYKEQPPADNFLKVAERDIECVTDVSEGESDNEVEEEEGMPESVIKRVPQ